MLRRGKRKLVETRAKASKKARLEAESESSGDEEEDERGDSSTAENASDDDGESIGSADTVPSVGKAKEHLLPQTSQTHRSWCERCRHRVAVTANLSCDSCSVVQHADCTPLHRQAQGSTAWTCKSCTKREPSCTLCRGTRKSTDSFFRCFRCLDTFHSDCLSNLQPAFPVSHPDSPISVRGNTEMTETSLFNGVPQSDTSNMVFFRDWKCPACLTWDAKVDLILGYRSSMPREHCRKRCS